jgi:hypothetical protein
LRTILSGLSPSYSPSESEKLLSTPQTHLNCHLSLLKSKQDLSSLTAQTPICRRNADNFLLEQKYVIENWWQLTKVQWRDEI